MPKRSKKVYKSAKTGKFVKKSYAKKHPSTTFSEKVRSSKKRSAGPGPGR